MASATIIPTETAVESGSMTPVSVQAPAPVTPGKVAMWLFLATEVMFFTGLIGSYMVLRAGSPVGSYSNLYPPNTDLSGLAERRGVVLEYVSGDAHAVVEAIRAATGLDEAAAEQMVHAAPIVVKAGLTEADAGSLAGTLKAAGASVQVEELKRYNWPIPYDHLINPLSIDLTAANTFILICSSVSMVMGLSAIQRGNRRGLTRWLVATVVMGSIFLGVQVYEYRSLLFEHHYSPGVSANAHFVPAASLFASCFFTMTGFHGAHVAAGVLMLTIILIQSMRGAFTQSHHSAVELVGLYWHFVDLVWILLFTVVYLI